MGASFQILTTILPLHHTPAAARRLGNLEAYVARHPRTALIEHPRDVARIVSR